MSMGYRGKTTNASRETVAVQAQAEREATWGEITGTIVSFDPATQTASIQPDYKPRHNGEPVAMPQLEEVPVRFTRAGGFVITTPVKAGDKVTLRPQMRSSEEFHTGGDYAPVGDTRSFALSDMEAFLDGGEALTDPIPNFNSTNMEIRTADGSFKIEMSEDGKFKIEGAQGNVYELLARLAEIVAEHETNVTTGSSAGTYSHTLAGEASAIAAKLRGMQA
jgi:hypothetical protein